MTRNQVFMAERVIDGHAVTFRVSLRWRTSMNGEHALPPKTIDVKVHGGGFGSCDSWPEAMAMAREYVGFVVERKACLAGWKATRDIDRATDSARHEAKQRARAKRARGQLLVLPIVCARQASAP